MSRNPETCPHVVIDYDYDGDNAHTYCVECGTTDLSEVEEPELMEDLI